MYISLSAILTVMNIHVTVEGPAPLSPIDYVPRPLGQGDISLTDWFRRIIITWQSEVRSPSGPSLYLATDVLAVP